MTAHRLPDGGEIDRDRTLRFTFDGGAYAGHPGDTLASALLANGVRCVGRSFKYHRPRGIVSAGPEEPNALVRLNVGGRAAPNTRATMVALHDGLVAESQNRWPSLRFDLRAVHQLFAPLLPAGFYYKTFMSPARAWPLYERQIRHAAGMGEGAREPDPDRYERRYAHCDVLVVGSGPAGLCAALAAARSGARVILVDERADFGGSLRWTTATVDGAPAAAWVARAAAELGANPRVTLARRTTAFGYYDHNQVALAERVTDHLERSPAHLPRERRWLVRAGRVILAAGAIERPMVFPGNDRPGVMLASAIRAYANQYGVAAGERVAVFTNNDDAYRTAVDLHRAGVAIAGVMDARAQPESPLVAEAEALGIPVFRGHVVARTSGARALEGVAIAATDSRSIRRIDCDALAVSGGFNPTLHLHSQSGGRVRFDAALAAFVPGEAKQASRCAGAAAGVFGLRRCMEDGSAAGADAARSCGFAAVDATLPACGPEAPFGIAALWEVRSPGAKRAKAFVDLQNDVLADDLRLAHRENYGSVEHLKRYTTLGMGTDQGKIGNVNGLAILAAARDEPIPAVGTTTFRPPYTPVTLGALAGPDRGRDFEPVRRTPLHAWHEASGALMTTVGVWLRPRTYPRPGERFDDAWRREAKNVRERVGLADVSTLGKIDVQGPDALAFLERVYCNNLKSLGVGRVRYGLMLREDGMVFDDGTIARLDDERFFITCTTANAGKVLAHLEFLLQAVWPDLAVRAASVSDEYAQIALAGRSSRRVLQATFPDADLGDAALPHLGTVEARVGGIAARVFRLSYSGERAYEIAVRAGYAMALWERLLELGEPDGIMPYGTEAMGALRIEKGHVAGPELDGRTTAADLGMARLVSGSKRFVGAELLTRPGLGDPDRLALVGLVPSDGRTSIRAGSQLIRARATPPIPMLGHVSSATYSPTLGHPIALGLLAGGLARKDETMVAASPLTGEYVSVRVTEPVFYDPQGERLRG